VAPFCGIQDGSIAQSNLGNLSLGWSRREPDTPECGPVQGQPFAVVTRGAWFTIDEAKERIKETRIPFLDRLLIALDLSE
jgi:predicted NUDIX family NTP pyrophosphohydrolase